MEPKPQPYPAPAYAASSAERQDTEHLQLLSVFYYIMATMTAFGGFFALIYVLFGVAMMGSAAAINDHSGESTGLAVAGGFFALLGLGATVTAWVIAGCLYLVGKYLREGRHRTFCFIVAGILCLNLPLGAVLGICTFIVLSRDSVRARFAANQPNPFAPPAGTDFKKYT